MNRSQLFVSFILLLSLLGCTKPIQPESYAIIPQPNTIAYMDDYLNISNGIHINSNLAGGTLISELLMDIVAQTSGDTAIFNSGKESTPLLLNYVQNMPKEHYKLNIDTDKISIEASSDAGMLYGFQTLLQILHNRSTSATIKLRCCEISDAPRFTYRGMHFDVSRHFFTMDELKAFANNMLYYKLNKLHLHLTDDQGWRLQIEQYPLLTEKGAWRLHDKNDSLCIKRAQEDATFAIPEDRYKTKDGKRMYGGWYSKDEMHAFIQYCSKRNIEIIPEIDVPGHFKAAIENYPYLSCTDQAGWGDHFSYPACLGKASTYTFIEDVLTEVAELFPSRYIHIGGDEVNKDEWKKCAKCQLAIRKNKLKDEHELQSYFNHHIEQFLAKKGKKLMGWDEIVEGGLSSETTVMWWRNWAPNTLRNAAKNGNDVIITPDFEYYMDFPYSATPTQKTYDFEPVPEDFTAEMEQRVIGVQANIWTERIPNTKRLYYQSVPRMLALAETAWSAKEDKDYTAFEQRLEAHYTKFHAENIFYHLPTLTGFDEKTVFTDKAVFEIQVPSADMNVYYTLDGSTPTPGSKQYTQALEITESCKIRFRAYRGEVYSKIYESIYELQECAKPIKSEVKQGLKRQQYKGRFDNTIDVKTGTKAVAETTVSNFGLTDFEGKENYALVFSGYYNAPVDGVYQFFTISDDGDQLFINGQLVVDNDGSHGPRERKGAIALGAGLHQIQLIYRQIGGGATQKVMVQVPGKEKREVNASELFY